MSWSLSLQAITAVEQNPAADIASTYADEAKAVEVIPQVNGSVIVKVDH